MKPKPTKTAATLRQRAEGRSQELKREVNELRHQLGQPPAYPSEVGRVAAGKGPAC